jgi:hypothetical protein
MKLGDHVRKIKGYAWPGIIVADFTTSRGARRLVVECTVEEVEGALHIYNPEQLEPALICAAKSTLPDLIATIRAQADEIARYKAGKGPGDPKDCPGDNGDQCCGYPDVCRAAWEEKP